MPDNISSKRARFYQFAAEELHRRAAEYFPLLGFLRDSQNELNAPFISSGRGSGRGRAKWVGASRLAWLTGRRGRASAGCCLLSPSIINENAPKVRQLCNRACGAPGDSCRAEVNEKHQQEHKLDASGVMSKRYLSNTSRNYAGVGAKPISWQWHQTQLLEDRELELVFISNKNTSKLFLSSLQPLTPWSKINWSVEFVKEQFAM